MNEPRRMVSLNGTLVAADEARVSVFDGGFLYGDGIYETLRAYGSKPFAWARHLVRLEKSAASTGLATPTPDALRHAVEETLLANGTPEAIVRITITRGQLQRRLDLSSAGAPTVLVTTDRIDPDADETRRQGVRVIYSRYLRFANHPLAGVKSTNYQISLFARNEAVDAGAAEVLIPNESGEIVEAAAANVFLIENDRVITPPLRAGILGGITRELVIELAQAQGLEVTESTLAHDRIASCDELFLSGTTIRVCPVTQVEDVPVGDGTPGPRTLALLDAYVAAVQADVGAVGPDRSSERIL